MPTNGTGIFVLPMYEWICPNCKVIRKQHKSFKHICRFCWGALWLEALDNMPWMAIEHLPLKTGTYKRGRATALRMCLGYRVYSAKGRNNAQAAVWQAIMRGQVPLRPSQQNLLRALAGPYGAILAKARLNMLHQADRFKYWP